MKTMFKKTIFIASVFALLATVISCEKEEENNDKEVNTNCDCGCDEMYGRFIDGRDGHEYKTIQIGDQIWMAENLAYLPVLFTSLDPWQDASKYFIYDDSTELSQNYKLYGTLYNMKASETACPEGWHLPTVSEWDTLFIYLIKNDYGYCDNVAIAKSLAATCYWETPESNIIDAIGADLTTNNSSCFSALPGGYFNFNKFKDVGKHAAWWVVQPIEDENYDEQSTYYHGLYYNKSVVSYHSVWKGNNDAYSIRCVKNE